MIIVLIGYMASGKTSLGKKLAKKLNYDFIDLDDFIEEKEKAEEASREEDKKAEAKARKKAEKEKAAAYKAEQDAAIEKRRLEKLAIDPHKDRLALQQVETAVERSGQLNLPSSSQEGEDLRWMIEELRVSLFAQQLGTKYPISLKRVLNHISELEKRK